MPDVSGPTSNGVYIDGRWRPAHSTEVLTVINPATEEIVGSAPDGDQTDIYEAVMAARRALAGPWSRTSAAERADLLRKLADALPPHAVELSELITSENGSPVSETSGAAAGASAVLRWYADRADLVDGVDIRPTPTGLDHTLVRRVPVGVVGMITPWNFPVSLVINKLAPAILAGCTLVLKPAPETPLDVAILIAACEAAGIPPGVVNLVTGGPRTGEALVGHPGIDKIAFTGSTIAGRAISTICGSLMRPVTLELGGKSAAIILDDADVDVFRETIMRVSVRNTGQTCYAATRILAPAHRYDEFVNATVETFATARQGDPRDPATVFGPLVSARQRERVEGFISSGRAEGAVVALGGGRPAAEPRGFYIEPTVFADVGEGMRIAREEIFGPVVCVLPFQDDGDAIRIANDSAYGLGGVVYSRDVQRATALADRMDTGTVGINHYTANPAAPFGGRKHSGLGTELGPEGLDAYLRFKSIYRQGPA